MEVKGTFSPKTTYALAVHSRSVIKMSNFFAKKMGYDDYTASSSDMSYQY
jgi:hypothetical protein